MVDALGPRNVGSVQQVKRVTVSDEKPAKSQKKEEEESESDEEREARRKGSRIDDHV